MNKPKFTAKLTYNHVICVYIALTMGATFFKEIKVLPSTGCYTDIMPSFTKFVENDVLSPYVLCIPS